jgi:hypothetical protein
MKTSERVLITALELFNLQGENNVSSVDIAMEMDISPGNLYYHFKGKEIIIAALFELHQEQMQRILRAPTDKDMSVEDFFYFLYLLLEQIHLFRFFYRNLSDLMEKYSNLAKGFKKLILAQNQCMQKLIEHFIELDLLKANRQECQQMVDLIGLVFTQGPNYYSMQGQDINDENYLYNSLAKVLFALLPYMSLPPDTLQKLQGSIASESLVDQMQS